MTLYVRGWYSVVCALQNAVGYTCIYMMIPMSLRPKAVPLQCESLKPRRETTPHLCTYSRVSGMALGLFLLTRIRDNHCVLNVRCFSLNRDLNTLSFIRTDEMRILVSPKEQFKPEHEINQKEF